MNEPCWRLNVLEERGCIAPRAQRQRGSVSRSLLIDERLTPSKGDIGRAVAAYCTMMALEHQEHVAGIMDTRGRHNSSRIAKIHLAIPHGILQEVQSAASQLGGKN